jgi:hypothetical protein
MGWGGKKGKTMVGLGHGIRVEGLPAWKFLDWSPSLMTAGKLSV